LRELKSLTQLILSNTKVTNEALRALKRELRNLNIER